MAITFVVVLSVPTYFYIKDPQEVRVNVGGGDQEHKSSVFLAICSLEPLKQIKTCLDWKVFSEAGTKEYLSCLSPYDSGVDQKDQREKEKIMNAIQECTKRKDLEMDKRFMNPLKGKTLIIHFE